MGNEEELKNEEQPGDILTRDESADMGNNEIIDVIISYWNKLFANARLLRILRNALIGFVTFVTIIFLFVFKYKHDPAAVDNVKH